MQQQHMQQSGHVYVHTYARLNRWLRHCQPERKGNRKLLRRCTDAVACWQGPVVPIPSHIEPHQMKVARLQVLASWSVIRCTRAGAQTWQVTAVHHQPPVLCDRPSNNNEACSLSICQQSDLASRCCNNHKLAFVGHEVCVSHWHALQQAGNESGQQLRCLTSGNSGVCSTDERPMHSISSKGSGSIAKSTINAC